MNSFSNCFSYLGINFYQKDIPEKIPKNFNVFIKFVNGLNISYSQNFVRNLAFLHNAQKFCQQVPTLENVYKIFERNFIKKAVNNKCFFIKNWNEEMIYLLVWVISVCEILFNKSFHDFSTYEWQIISNLLPKSEAESLKYKWFTLISSVRSPEWSKEEDDTLLEILRETEENLFVANFQGIVDVKWSKISMDLSRRSTKSICFKTSKQCRERWLNHLNPFLNKEIWTFQEDIHLLEEAIAKKKSWSEISKSFQGRTQHTVKNRFLAVMGKEMVLSRTSIRALLRKMNNEQLIVDVLNKLKLNNTLTLKEIIEPLTDPKDMQQTNTSKRVLNKFWIESPALKKRVRSSEEFQQNMLNSFETNNPFEQNFTFENKESNNLLDALVDKFNIWKEIEEEPEKRRNGIEEDDQNHMNRLFNVDDFFS